MRQLFSTALALALLAGAAGWTAGSGMVRAGEADVVRVEAVSEGTGSWRFHVTVAHGDSGWDHYADKWDGI